MSPVPLKHFRVYLKPFKLDDAIAALQRFRLEGLVVSECRGYGRQKGHLELYEGSEYEITFLPKVRLEFLASAFDVDAIVSAIEQAARTGRIGDGKVLVTSVRATEEDYA